jgi:hypothetical protein
MPEIVTDFQPFENSKKPLKTIAHCDFAPRFLPTKIREEPDLYDRFNVFFFSDWQDGAVLAYPLGYRQDQIS